MIYLVMSRIRLSEQNESLFQLSAKKTLNHFDITTNYSLEKTMTCHRIEACVAVWSFWLHGLLTINIPAQSVITKTDQLLFCCSSIMGAKFHMCVLLIILGITAVYAAEEMARRGRFGYAAEKDRRGKKRVANQYKFCQRRYQSHHWI